MLREASAAKSAAGNAVAGTPGMRGFVVSQVERAASNSVPSALFAAMKLKPDGGNGSGGSGNGQHVEWAEYVGRGRRGGDPKAAADIFCSLDEGDV